MTVGVPLHSAQEAKECLKHVKNYGKMKLQGFFSKLFTSKEARKPVFFLAQKTHAENVKHNSKQCICK